jgi:signal transduction histidine kinase
MRSRSRSQPLLFGAISALVAAATLVIFLQYRATAQQSRHTQGILQQVCERTATVVSDRLRGFFEGAVLEILEGIGHPEVKRYDMQRVVAFLTRGSRKYPYVERFFFWSERSPAPFREQVMFFRRPEESIAEHTTGVRRPEDHFFADPVLGQQIFALSRRVGQERKSFAVTQVDLDGRRYQLILHFLWDDATRQQAFAILGFLVNLTAVRETLFASIADGALLDVLKPNSSSPSLELTIFDEAGQHVYGPQAKQNVPSASAEVSMLFFPAEALRQWLAGPPPTPPWRLVVWVSDPVEPRQQGLSLFAGILALLAIATFCAVSVNRQSLRLSRMQADFVANVSHQLKTPLSSLAAATETLRFERVRSPEKLTQYAAIIGSQTERLSALVEQILQFSRLEAADGLFERESLDLGRFAHDVVDQFASCQLQPTATIRFDGPERPVMISGDRNALEHVIVNLLTNAIKYGGAEENDVHVAVAVEGDEAVLRVRDRGMGIDAADLPHIFEKFYRGHNNGNGRRGFGLGLAIVDNVVRGHGGRIAVLSERGSGTEFAVFLPAAG